MRVAPLSGVVRHWWMFLLAMVLASAAAYPLSAQAQPIFQAGSVCHAKADLTESYADLADQGSRWSCERGGNIAQADRIIIRFDLSAQNTATAPRYFAFYRAEFEQVGTQFVTQEAPSAPVITAYKDIFVGPEAHLGFVELPQTPSAPTALIVTLDGAAYPADFVDGKLMQDPPVKINAGLVHLLAALICGLLLAPIMFDLGFHRTLRETFPLYHALFCMMAAVQTASISGLIPLLFNVSSQTEHVISYISFDLMLLATILFVGSFLEVHLLTKRHRRLLALAASMPVITATLMTFPHAIAQEWLGTVVYLCLAIMLSALFYVMGAAWRRGSRSIRYVTLAFAPLLTIGVLRITGALVPPLFLDFSEMWAQNFALAFEVVVTSFAVADRFFTIKRERDNAVDAARSLAAISEHDPLTGLLNRRALEARFELLRAEGFTALAVVDLDHFKAINDTYGHQLGDEVLVCAARALRGQEDPDLLAFRIGGEEFLVLLRGRNKQLRAEARRAAITSAVARELSIDRKVTASMGYIEASAGAIASASFEALYERADRLLYEAKERGRDMTVAERVKVFWRREESRRGERQAA